MSHNAVEDYGWASEEGPHSCAYIAPRILELLAQLKSKRVLDLGAGNGKLCAAIAKSGFDVVGVEYDQAGVDIARESYPEIPFYNFGVQDDASDLLRDQSAFDVVVSTEVIEHLFSPHLLPKYAHAVLAEEGYLVITTPYHGYLKNLLISIFNKWDGHFTALWHGGHIKFWSRNTLRELLHENGFEEVAFSGVGRVPFLWKSMVMVAKKTRIDSACGL